MLSARDAIVGCWICLLVIGATTDLANRKVYNWLTFSAIGLGLALNVARAGWPGLGAGVLGCLAGGLIFYPAFYWGGLGAGDVKMLAAIGALMGWEFALQTAFYASLAGGILALLVMLTSRNAGRVMRNTWRLATAVFRPAAQLEFVSEQPSLPYAVAIAAGSAAAFWLPLW